MKPTKKQLKEMNGLLEKKIKLLETLLKITQRGWTRALSHNKFILTLWLICLIFQVILWIVMII